MGFRVSGGEFGGLADAFRMADENEKKSLTQNAVYQPGVSPEPQFKTADYLPSDGARYQEINRTDTPTSPDIGGMGAMGAPPAPALPMGPVETERTVTTQTTAPVARPEEKGIQDGMDALAREQEGRLGQAKAIAEKEAEIGIATAGAKQAQADGYAKRIGEIENEEKEKDRLAVEQLEADEKAFRGAKITDYWSDKTTGHKVMAGIGMLLGSAAGYQGRSNPAVGVIERAIDQDFQRQKANIDKLEKQYGMSRTKREDIRATFDRKRTQLDAKRIAATDAIIARAEAEAAKLGPSKVGLKFAEEIDKLKGANLERRQKYFEGLRENKSTSTTTKMVTPTAPGAYDETAEKATGDWYERYTRNPTTQRTTQLENSFSGIQSTDNSPAGQVALVYQFMKMLDPGSTVMQGEYATAENTAGIPERVRNLYNKAREGKPLGEKQIKEFKSSARALLDAQRRNQANFDKQFKKALPRIVDPERAMARGGFEDPPEQSKADGGTAPAQGPRVGETVDGFRFKGGDPSKQENWEAVK